MVKREVEKRAFCSKCFGRLFFIALVVFVSHIIFVSGKFFHSDISFHNIISNLFLVVMSFLAVFSSFWAYRRVPSNFPREKKGNLFFAFSMLFFFIGDIIWMFYESVLHELTPVGFLPDLAWNISYIFIIVSLIYFILISFRPTNKILYFILVLGVLVGGAILYSDVIEDISEESFTFVHFIQDMYLFYDIIILLIVLYLLWPLIFPWGGFGLHWIVLGIGIFARFIFDFIFAEISARGTYYTGHPLDILYVVLYLGVVFSSYIKIRGLQIRK